MAVAAGKEPAAKRERPSGVRNESLRQYLALHVGQAMAIIKIRQKGDKTT